ncbi:ABC transporter permease [Dactylosporangium sp. NPDC000521]|uniref:ABC transporter permease n=1 Tax=Dactylosporangium sp. NPDC000521 TaxID=3363975 RepID=UPI003677015C
MTLNVAPMGTAPATTRGGEREPQAPVWSRFLSHGVVRFAVRSVVRLVLVVIGVLTLLFVLLRIAGDPAKALAGQDATPADLLRIRAQLGLDRPIMTQYWEFVTRAFLFDFGDSYKLNTDAMGEVLHRLPATLGLILAALALAPLIGIPLGMIAALARSRIYDKLMDVIVVGGQAIPVFAVAVLLVYLFGVELRWVPTLATAGFASDPRAILLPVLVLAIHPISRILEVTRAGLADSMQEDFVRTALSKGVPPARLVTRHAIRPVLNSLITVLGVDFAGMLSGGVVVEFIFVWPGLGHVLISGVSNRDYPIVGAATFVAAVLVVLVNLIIDIAYRQLDPRIRKGR